MIRYNITRAQLQAVIQAESSDWLTRAKARTETFRALGHYEETTPMWSEVKAVADY